MDIERIPHSNKESLKWSAKTRIGIIESPTFKGLLDFCQEAHLEILEPPFSNLESIHEKKQEPKPNL